MQLIFRIMLTMILPAQTTNILKPGLYFQVICVSRALVTYSFDMQMKDRFSKTEASSESFKSGTDVYSSCFVRQMLLQCINFIVA